MFISRLLFYLIFDESIYYFYFLHAKPWISGDEKSIFTAIIH